MNGRRGIPFLEARHGQCRWFVSDELQLVCGEPAVDPASPRPGRSSWCKAHYRIVYVRKADPVAEFRFNQASPEPADAQTWVG